MGSLERSHPSRGGWIEMYNRWIANACRRGPTPHGVGGLKCLVCTLCRLLCCRPTPHGVGGLKCLAQTLYWQMLLGPTPHGVGGLKFIDGHQRRSALESHPSRGGWIEIQNGKKMKPKGISPTPHGVGGLKSRIECGFVRTRSSHPSRGGWIEIIF